MQFTSTILTFAIAATGALAAPSAELGERQANSITVQYFTGNNCDAGTEIGPLITYTDLGNACDFPFVGIPGIRSLRVPENLSAQNVRFYNNTECQYRFPTVGTYVEIPAGQPVTDCRSQSVLSVDFAPFT